ncbi:MAG: type VI secretion system baseplate subunit TssE [Gemmataceae bacterium]
MDEYPPSILDRFIDLNMAPGRARYSQATFEATVLRDLEELLNTKRATDGFFEGLPLVAASVANFGLRDVTHKDSSAATEREAYAQHILEVIQVFEPRLTNVMVLPRDPYEVQMEVKDRFRTGAVYFRIRATLNVDPVPIEGVIFDTVLDLAKGRHEVNTHG